jgi:serine/threonine protein kinase
MVAASSYSKGSEDPQDEEPEEEEDEYESYSSEEQGSSSAEPVQPKHPRSVGNRWKVGVKLGAGSYSEVFRATDRETGEAFAVKMEWQKAEKTDKLLKEAELYKELQHGSGIPRVRWSGSQGEYNLMVLDLLGPSLDDLFKKLRRFSVKTVSMLAKQVITRLQFVHKCGILYRDIKPHNFLMGVGEKGSRKVYLVDFGLSKRYLDRETGEHYKCKIEKGRGIAGTVRYSSPFLHEGYEASRRDDMFALGYVLMHLLRGELPWLGISAKDKKVRNKRIGKKKDEVSDEDLCRGFPRQFVEYFRYLRSLGFYDEPDYDRLQRLFDQALEEASLPHDYVYDWTTSSGDPPAKRRRLRA